MNNAIDYVLEPSTALSRSSEESLRNGGEAIVSGSDAKDKSCDEDELDDDEKTSIAIARDIIDKKSTQFRTRLTVIWLRV